MMMDDDCSRAAAAAAAKYAVIDLSRICSLFTCAGLSRLALSMTSTILSLFFFFFFSNLVTGKEGDWISLWL